MANVTGSLLQVVITTIGKYNLFKLYYLCFTLTMLTQIIPFHIFSITHKDRSDKTSITVKWTKPDDYNNEDLYLRYSIVTEKKKYWVGLEYPPKQQTPPQFNEFFEESNSG